jgi:predicted house-cleaning noncanonical NTP pyrophosphatase (MazG superfamily)
VISKEMGTIKYNKLVRDKIPEIIKNTGKHAVLEKLESGDYKKY